MTEIISLLSSPPESPLRGVTKPTTSESPTLTKHIGSHALAFLDDFDDIINPPSKRRKANSDEISRAQLRKSPRLKLPDFALSSDFDLSPVPIAVTKNVSGSLQVPKSSAAVDGDLDEIVFSSSAPEARRKSPYVAKNVVYDLSSDDEANSADPAIENDSFSFSQPVEGAKDRPAFSERTMNLLASLDVAIPESVKSGSQRFAGPVIAENRPNVSKLKKPGVTRKVTVETVDQIVFSSSPSKTQKKAKSKKDSKDMVDVGKSQDKEVEKERKRKEKEEKAKDKQKAAEMAEVNKSKTNRKESAREMFIEISSSFQGTALGNHLEESMKELEVPISYFHEEVDLIDGDEDTASIGNIVRWRRKVSARFDEDTGQWEPISKPEIKFEQHVLVYLNAIEFATIIIGNGNTAVISEAVMKKNLDDHVTSIRRRYNDCTPIYLIQGLSAWLKKNQTARNREFTAAVRAQALEDDETAIPVSTQPQSRKRSTKKSTTSTIDFSSITSETTETLLLHLQLHHSPIQIQHTTSISTSAHQINIFTQHLSTRPYRLAAQSQNLKSASFCMDTGQIRTGDDTKDTYIKMLQEIQRVTPSMAYGIANAGWGNVRELIQGFRKDGNLMLEDVKKSANKDGAWSERRLGPMVSKRLYKVFMGRDPKATDGMA